MENRHLFRGKRIDNGVWACGYLYGIWEKRYILWGMFNDIPGMIEVDPATVCQCTGLKDKNGKLIFENDIVDGHIRRGAAFRNCVILWSECKARFDVRAMDCNFPMTLDECVDDISICGLDYEIVGNIFDNPELLEV